MRGDAREQSNQVIHTGRIQHLTTELYDEDDVEDKPMDTVATCCVVSVPDSFAPVLDVLLLRVRKYVLPRMLHLRECSSSKFYTEIPCVVAKSLITKYQRNKKLVTVKSIVLPICGDKGKQIKLEKNGLRIPALFKKEILPVTFPKPVVGWVRSIEFFKRKGQWLVSVCYNTYAQPQIEVAGCIGIDRNSVGNVAVLADPQNGQVRHLGFNPAATKDNWRRRRASLKSQGKTRTLRQLSRKQSRRTKHENHIVSKQIVSYAKLHRRAIAVENLENVRKPKSKIRGYVERSQWAFYQLLQYITYKAALLGVPVIKVNPAYTSQDCSRCGQRTKPNGKIFVCASCRHKDHRDSNSAFNIGMGGNRILDVGLLADSVSRRSGVLVTPFLATTEAYAYA